MPLLTTAQARGPSSSLSRCGAAPRGSREHMPPEGAGPAAGRSGLLHCVCKCASASKATPTISPQNLDRLLRSHAADHFRKLEALLASLPPRCLLFAGYCSRSLARAEAKGREGGGPPSISRIFGLGGDSVFPGAGDDAGGMLDRFGRAPGVGRARKSTKAKVRGCRTKEGSAEPGSSAARRALHPALPTLPTSAQHPCLPWVPSPDAAAVQDAALPPGAAPAQPGQGCELGGRVGGRARGLALTRWRGRAWQSLAGVAALCWPGPSALTHAAHAVPLPCPTTTGRPRRGSRWWRTMWPRCGCAPTAPR